MEQENPCGCINREPLRPKRKRRFSGCGILDIDPTVAKTWFRVESSAYASAKQLLLDRAAMRMDIVRKGQDCAFVSYDAFSTDNDGNVSFYWDSMFLDAPSGFYLGDVFFREQYCFTVQFRIRRCEAVIVECRNEHEVVGCAGFGDVIGAQGIPTTCADKSFTPQDVIETEHQELFGEQCDPLPADDCGPSGCTGGIGSDTTGEEVIGADDE